jgi:ParB family chromosome partitioning protein
MKSKRLGKGLHALIPTDNSNDGEITTNDVNKIDIASIEPNPGQPRIIYDEIAFQELKESIRQRGIIQPISVRRLSNGKFQIVAGERRFRAATELRLRKIPVYIMDISSDGDTLEISLIENVQRENLNPIELAKGYQRLMVEWNLTQEDIANKIGKDRATIANVIRLLKLPQEIQDSLQRGEIKEGHARSILAIPDPKTQKEIWRKTLKNSLSVRRVEQLVKKYQTKFEEKDPQGETKSRKSPFINKVESKLREKFGTQVKIRKRKETGSIEILFYSKEDFERLMDIFEQIRF